MGAVREALEDAAKAIRRRNPGASMDGSHIAPSDRPVLAKLDAALAGPDPEAQLEECRRLLAFEKNRNRLLHESMDRRLAVKDLHVNEWQRMYEARTRESDQRITALEAERDAELARVTTLERMTVEQHGEIDRLRALLARVEAALLSVQSDKIEIAIAALREGK